MNERREQMVLRARQVPSDSQMDHAEAAMTHAEGGAERDGHERGRDTERMSTAEMAAAMERRGDEGTGGVARALERNGGGMTDGTNEPLFPSSEASDYRSRWLEIQAGFVDEPGRSVEHADALVAEVIQRLAQVFAQERENLEGQWGRGGDVDTESLRLALRRYRSFFERLLSA